MESKSVRDCNMRKSLNVEQVFIEKNCVSVLITQIRFRNKDRNL